MQLLAQPVHPAAPDASVVLLHPVQSLDTAALVLCLLNMALQTIGMLWLLAEYVRLARLPRRVARGLSSVWRSWTSRGSRRARQQAVCTGKEQQQEGEAGLEGGEDVAV